MLMATLHTEWYYMCSAHAPHHAQWHMTWAPGQRRRAGRQAGERTGLLHATEQSGIETERYRARLCFPINLKWCTGDVQFLCHNCGWASLGNQPGNTQHGSKLAMRYPSRTCVTWIVCCNFVSGKLRPTLVDSRWMHRGNPSYARKYLSRRVGLGHGAFGYSWWLIFTSDLNCDPCASIHI